MSTSSRLEAMDANGYTLASDIDTRSTRLLPVPRCDCGRAVVDLGVLARCTACGETWVTRHDTEGM